MSETTRQFTVKAVWDKEASIWVATSDDVPGLATEAETMDALVEKLKNLIPELLELNGIIPPDGPEEIPFHLHSELTETAYKRAC